MGVSVEVADGQRWRRLCKVIEDRTMIDAVLAPGAGQAENLHLAFKPAEQHSLRRGEIDRRMHGGPTPAMLLCAMAAEEFFVRQSLRKLRGKVHRCSQLA